MGALMVAPWLLFSVQGVRDDAPDMPLEWAWLVLGAQIALTAAFLANWWRAGLPVLLAAIVGYASAIAGAAANNDGAPVLAMLLFAGPPMLVAAPLILPRLSRRTGWFSEQRLKTRGGTAFLGATPTDTSVADCYLREDMGSWLTR